MTSRTHLLTLATLLLAFAARLNTLGDLPFWYDEGLVGWTARRDWLATARWTAADVHPPLYFWAVGAWRLFAGESEFALRLVSVSVGVLSVVAVYKIGERLQEPALGNLAALFIGLSRFHIWWSQELRMYILGSMFMLFSVWLTLRIAHSYPKRADWLAYILVSAAGLFSIYLVAFALLFESFYVTAVWLLANINLAPRRQDAKTKNLGALAPLRDKFPSRKYLQWIGAQAVVALLFLPWFLYFLTQFRTWSDSTPFDPALFVQFYATLLAVGAPSSIDQWLVPVGVIWAALIVSALIGLRGKHDGAARRGGWLIVMLLLLPPLSVYLGSTNQRSFFYTPRVEARYLMPFIWSFYLVLAWCVWRIAKAQRIVGALAALLVVVLSGASLAQYYASRVPNDVYQSLAATLRAYRQPGDGVLLHDDRTWPIFEFYYASGERDWKGVPNGSKIKAQDADFILSDYWNAHDAVWMVWNEDALRIDENHSLEQWLGERAVLTRAMPFGNKRLIFYARTAERAKSVNALAAIKPTYAINQYVGVDVRLLGYDQAIRSYRVGDEVILGLYLENTSQREVELSVASFSGDRVAIFGKVTAAPGLSHAIVHFPATLDMPARSELALWNGARAHVPFTNIAIAPPSALIAQADVNIQTPREVRFDKGIKLVGYDPPASTLHAGDNFSLTLYWQSEQPIAQRYKAFVHLLGQTYNARSKNFLWGQQDQEPLNGALPTTSWSVGRVVSDPYLFRIAPDAPRGRYIVEVGWYHPTTGERLAVADDGADHVNLFEVELQ